MTALQLQTLIVDDEPLARQTVRRLLSQDPAIAIAGEYGDGKSALKAIQQLHPQLVYLDIRMPGMSGINLLAQIPPAERPAVIFATAFDSFAVRAFELFAIDYLLKPFSDERFFQSLARAKARFTGNQLPELSAQVEGLLSWLNEPKDVPPLLEKAAALPEPAAETPFMLRAGHDRHLLNPREIRWVEGQSDYARIHLLKGSIFVRKTLTSLEEQLPGNFVRIHKSTIVNVERVARIRPRNSGDWAVELDDGTLVRASRNYRKRLKERIAPAL